MRPDLRTRPTAAELVSELTNAHVLARCLHVLAELGVADALDDDPAAPGELALRTGMDADALARMLRLTAAHGVFAAAGAGYVHTAASRLLRSDHPQSLRALVRMRGSPVMWRGVTALGEAARTGRAAAHGWASLLDYFAARPAEARVFNDAMAVKSRHVVAAVLDAYDFGGCAVVADIGAGPGHLVQAVLERAPAAVGVLFDLPHVVADAASTPSPRLEAVAGDFFVDALPAADAYLLMDVLHDWSDADAGTILAAVRRAAPGDARVLIIETLVPETPGPHVGKTLDVVMLAVTGGRERTAAEHGALLAAAGFRLLRVVPTRTPYSIVEAAPTRDPRERAPT